MEILSNIMNQLICFRVAPECILKVQSAEPLNAYCIELNRHSTLLHFIFSSRCPAEAELLYIHLGPLLCKSTLDAPRKLVITFHYTVQ